MRLMLAALLAFPAVVQAETAPPTAPAPSRPVISEIVTADPTRQRSFPLKVWVRKS